MRIPPAKLRTRAIFTFDPKPLSSATARRPAQALNPTIQSGVRSAGRARPVESNGSSPQSVRSATLL